MTKVQTERPAPKLSETAQNIKRRFICNNTANTKPWHLVELEDNPDISCIKWQHMFLGIVDYHAPCKRRRVGNVAP